MPGLTHECGDCLHVWKTTSFSTECPKCGSMKGMARPDGFHREEATQSQSDELAELMIMFEYGMFEKL